MCCIFTCCGWMIDLVQRLWTFTMSCCISSAVCCVMLTSSMSGIALGYNYSLAEYIDLKETNVSVYLKRGVFDDEIADDMDWRRAGRMPVAGHIGENNLVTGGSEDDVTPVRSGRRLDDSVFEADDQNRYEGSLMKLTAKPQLQSTEPHFPTPDHEMGQLKPVDGPDPEVFGKYASPVPELDQLKAIKSLLDSRRAMNAGRTTLSPVATYSNLPFGNFPMYANPGARNNPDAARRMMGGFRPGPAGLGAPPSPDATLDKFPGINPARLAVPDTQIGAAANWVLPKKPHLFNEIAHPDMGPDYVISATYPPPITIRSGPSTTPRQEKDEIPDGAIIFATRTPVVTKKSHAEILREKMQQELEPYEKLPGFEREEPQRDYNKNKVGSKTSEEEYEDEIKGLPVRKRRSIKGKLLDSVQSTTSSTSAPIEATSRRDFSDITKLDDDSSLITIETTSYTRIVVNNNAFNQLNNEIHEVIHGFSKNDNNDSQAYTQVLANETDPLNHKQGLIANNTVLTTRRQNTTTTGNNLLGRLITSVIGEQLGDSVIRSLIPESKNKRRRKSFESEIVSSKSKPPRLIDTEAASIRTPELIDSISVQLNEGDLLRNPKSNLLKLLKSTFA